MTTVLRAALGLIAAIALSTIGATVARATGTPCDCEGKEEVFLCDGDNPTKGDDCIIGGGCLMDGDVIKAGKGDDVICPDTVAEITIQGGFGADTVNALYANQTFLGGCGDDTVLMQMTDSTYGGGLGCDSVGPPASGFIDLGRQDGRDCKGVRGDACDTCGDGLPQAGEQCDDGPQNGTVDSFCNTDCTIDGNAAVGTITADINRGGNPTGSDRGVESPAGNLVADAQAWATSSNGAQVAFMNPGGLRSDLTYLQSGTEGDGVVTFSEAFTFQPFGNALLTFPMTGAQIVSVLEEQCQPPGASRPFLHLGVSDGFTYDLSKTIVAGDCTSVTVSNVELNGNPVLAGTTYMVTVNSFLAAGGDNFDTFATIDPALRLDGGSDLEGLVDYLMMFSPVAPPNTDRVNEIP